MTKPNKRKFRTIKIQALKYKTKEIQGLETTSISHNNLDSVTSSKTTDPNHMINGVFKKFNMLHATET